MSLLVKRGDAAKRKRPAEAAAGAPAAQSVLPFAPTGAAAAASADSDLWVEKHAPRCSADLAMHKKKVEEVRHWLHQADASLQLGLPPSPRMLVLSGPPGAAKSTALRVVAAEMGFEICEWLEGRTLRWVPPEQGGGGGGGFAGYESRLTQFGHFLSSSLRTLSLSIASSGAGPSATPTPVGLRRRLVLLEELPVSVNSGEKASSQVQKHAGNERPCSNSEHSRSPTRHPFCIAPRVQTLKTTPPPDH